MRDERDGQAGPDVVVRGGGSEPVEQPAASPALAWAVLTALALPVGALLLVAVRALTGHSAFLAGTFGEGSSGPLYVRVSAAVFGFSGPGALLPTVVGLALVTLLPSTPHWTVTAPVRRAAAGLATVVTSIAALQALGLAYLFLGTPSSEGVAFVTPGGKVEQLAAPLAEAVCVGAITALLTGVLLARRPSTTPAPDAPPVHAAQTLPEPAPVPTFREESPPEVVEPEPPEEQAPQDLADGQDPYARYRRPS